MKTWRKQEEECVMTEAETGVMLPLAKYGWQGPEPRRCKEGFFPRAFGGNMALSTR